jgi:hypothetical protein
MLTVSASPAARLRLLGLALRGCDWFDKKKPPLPASGSPVFSDRKDIEPDKEAASIQVHLPAPVGERLLAAVGRLRQLRHAPSGGRRFAAGDLDADVGAGSSSSRILTTPPVVADGKVFAKDAESTVSAFNADTGQRSGA